MKILIVDEMHPSLLGMLDEQGWQYNYQPRFRRDDIIAHISAYEGLVIRSKTRVNEEVLAKAEKLRFVARAGAGLDLIDLDAIGGRDIRLFHAGEGNRDAVAEHTLGMLLCLFNNILKADRQIRQGTWDREGNRGIELLGKTVGIIGYGNNGSATARRLSGFGCKVLAYDKYRDNYGDHFAEEAPLERIKQEADVLSLHVPLTSETRQWVNEDFIAGFTKPFFLNNVARGEIVSLEAVVSGLESGKLRGACLDVLENEKLGTLTPEQQAAFDYLRTSDRVVLTPHVAGWSHESYVRINEVLVRQIREWANSASGPAFHS
ncbi:2-hydroxyacid dehydrogenase [Telluribacter sp.]|jgi:D-3-phosphoglycerate dehydrogenase|uniref:2-hydroxyacid dehydrogenase n=1 Tax=Telluribacter sp. TaxID=1978767 RepID=UPI002E128780|nr:2-hydroxyacid dehydrogenase [Telluribacter sp.]